MTHDKKIELWLAYAQENKLAGSYRRPPMDFVIQKFGLKVPPMIFWSFRAAWAGMGSYFGVTWGLFMYFALWRKQNMPALGCIISSLFAGFFFGLMMAWQLDRAKKKQGLSTWDAFPPASTK